MGRPVCLFTGQWADLPLEKLAAKTRQWGFDGLELACWGDHFEVDKALADSGYCQSRWDILNRHKLKCFAISTHLVGQAVCDLNIDERHKGILPPEIWGDGKPEGVRQRARTPANRLNFGDEAPQHDALLWRAVAGEGARATKIIIGRDVTCYVSERLRATSLQEGF